MLKQKKKYVLYKNQNYHNKYILYNTFKIVKVFFKKKTLVKSLKVSILNSTKNALYFIKPLHFIFNSVYNPRHLSFFKILYFQKKIWYYNSLYNRLLYLIKLRKLKAAKRLKSFIKNYKLKKKVIFFIVTIKIKRNNIFCSIVKNTATSKKLILFRSAGLYKIKLSRKTFKFKSRYFLNKFFNEIKKKTKPNQNLSHFYSFRKKYKKKLPKKLQKSLKALFLPNTILYGKVLAPKRMRKNLIIRFKRLMREQDYIKTFFLNLIEKKIFNGCRPKKKRRKKRQGLRVFK